MLPEAPGNTLKNGTVETLSQNKPLSSMGHTRAYTHLLIPIRLFPFAYTHLPIPICLHPFAYSNCLFQLFPTAYTLLPTAYSL